MIGPYYSYRKGKKYQKGWRARPKVGGKIIKERVFSKREKGKAQLWHDRIVSLAKKAYDFTFTLVDDFRGSINGKLYSNKAYECIKRDIPHWLLMLVMDLRPTDMSRLLRELDKACEIRLGRRRKHLKREVEVLHAVFEHYKNEKNIDFVNPIVRKHKRDWAKAKGNNRVISHTPEEAINFLKWLKGWHDPVFFHIAFWQLTSHRQRISEILSLEWKDIDWEKEIAWINGTIVHTDEHGKTVRNFKQYSTKEGRTGIPINFSENNQHLKESLMVLRGLKHSKRWVFADVSRNIPSLSQVRQVYKKSGYFNEKYLATHKCRKTAITLGTILCGVDSAKTHGGHSTWSAHGRYVDHQIRELSNPIPAAIAEVLKVKS